LLIIDQKPLLPKSVVPVGHCVSAQVLLTPGRWRSSRCHRQYRQPGWWCLKVV